MDIELSNTLSAVHLAMMDAAVKTNNRRLIDIHNKYSCKPGCSSCCSRSVFISVAESLVIQAELIHLNNWKQIRERASSLIKYVKLTNQLSWLKMNLNCPILDPDTKRCKAYFVRPSICSTHFVTSDPAVCDPWAPTSIEYMPEPMIDIHQEFERKLKNIIEGHGILNLHLPIPLGLLFAERIQHQKGLEFNEVINIIFNEL
jgi:Fe-S-cluster containining protein